MRQPTAALSGEVDAFYPHDHEDMDSDERLRFALSADVVVFQRAMSRFLVDTIPGLQARGIAVVIDIDDHLCGGLDPRHVAFDTFHPGRDPENNWHHLKRACQMADMVTVSTPELAARYGGARARVVPNHVSESLLTVTAPRDGRTVGWPGSTWTHIDDLTVTSGGVAQALRETGGRFLLVGKDPDSVRRQLKLPGLPDTVGYVALDEYPREVARFDVGIAPLRPTLFNQCKSALKPLEMAALGVPVVASPTPEYERLHAEGVCVLAQRSRDWRREVRRLLTDRQHASEQAARAREVVAERHTIEANAWKWAEAWADAAQSRHAAGRVAA